MGEKIPVRNEVTPCTGVWIETNGQQNSHKTNGSHSLYRSVDWNTDERIEKLSKKCHSLYRSVDWNYRERNKDVHHDVTPCTGVWIETKLDSNRLDWWRSHSLYRSVDWNVRWRIINIPIEGHSLYRSVDWNFWKVKQTTCKDVTPCTGVWIETKVSKTYRQVSMSLLVQECGLKPQFAVVIFAVPLSLLVQECGLKRKNLPSLVITT